ncbi:MAG TPA: NgoFVII family restriction endonuclease [Ignavibacteria bacterium]|nr:NgoFVII family restriction endonuclease [Ignavibacteria bacterium]
MFITNQSKKQVDKYSNLVKAICSLSKLFSDSTQPYISYRAIENIFCKAFNADNISRFDVTADARADKYGVAIKTFLKRGNSHSFEKIAEFNKEFERFIKRKPDEIVETISKFRNERIELTERIYNLNDLIYHCVIRSEKKIYISEENLLPIDIKKVKITDANKKSIKFSDSKNNYIFNLSKSTLFKKFRNNKFIHRIDVSIFDDPYTKIEEFLFSYGKIFDPIKSVPHIFLPLYSVRNNEVSEKSGLNQWNASGRQRDLNEIYIPIPSWIHAKFPKFFPNRDISFKLMLPNLDSLNAKVCQDNSKALMSNPNNALGKWLLRDVLNLKDYELLTYKKLETIGLDSVVIYKIKKLEYEINFAKLGSYQNFYNSYNRVKQYNEEIDIEYI